MRRAPLPESLPFDPDYYFGLVAENLARSFGARALHYTGEALQKMRRLGDDDGLKTWLAIHEKLTAQPGLDASGSVQIH